MKNSQKAKSELQKWLADSFNRQFMFERSRDNLKISMNNDFRDIGGFIQALVSLSYWYGANAVFNLPSDKNSAASDLKNMFFCNLLEARFTLKLYQKSQKPKFWSFLKSQENNKPKFSFIDNTSLLGTALSFGYTAEALEIGKNILHLLEENLYYDLNSRQTPRFILEIYCKWQKSIFPPEKFSVEISDIQRKLVNEIESADPEQFNRLISTACLWHIEKSGEDTDTENKEFSNPVETLFAKEILAACQIRKLCNKPVVFEDHVLIRDYLNVEKIVKDAKPDSFLETLMEKIEAS